MDNLISQVKGHSGGVTVIPNPEDDSNAKGWIRENLVVVAIIAVAVLLLIIIIIIFICVRRRRLAATSKEVNLNDTESQATQEVEPPHSSPSTLPESFVIIQSPNLHTRVHQKRKSTLAVPPAFSVSHKRKSVPSISHGRVGWTRWSTAGLELHTSPPSVEHDNPLPKGYLKKKRQSTPGIMMAVPVVYHRRVSHTPHHAVYTPECPSLPKKPLTP